jgi:hypothetical protein
MKKYFIFMTIIAFTCLYSQELMEKNVPAKIKKLVMEKYKNAKGLKWEKEENNYEVSFDFNEQKHSLLINNDGKILEIEKEIDEDQLSESIKSYLDDNYDSYVISKINHIEKLGKIFYEIEVSIDDKNYELLFSDKGKLIEKKAKDSDEDKNDSDDEGEKEDSGDED